MSNNNDKLRIIPLGGMGSVTQNMFLYEYGDKVLIVDCGIGFPENDMLGIDILIPDVSYLEHLLEHQGREIVGMILTHGHDDHIGATPYILPGLPEFPIYASPLTAGFAKNRMSESDAKDREVTVIEDGKKYEVGPFSFESLAMTHSVPDTKHFLINTPVGTIYHGSDYKFDKDPVDKVFPDYDRIEKAGKDGLLCMLTDCLRVERDEWTPSESTTGPAIEEELVNTKGKVFVTLMSTHIHRIQQTVDAAVKDGRKVTFIGYSVEKNTKVARELEMLDIPKGSLIDKRDIDNYSDDELCLIIAGSQGQEGSSLVRAVYGEHYAVSIKPDDKVIFSADAIPGNQTRYYKAIDELARNGVDVVYPIINENLHASGHAAAPEQQKLLQLTDPQYVMPIGGADRHRMKYIDFVAEKVGYDANRILIPGTGDVLAFDKDGRVSIDEEIRVNAQLVDGLGIGDVGPIVLRDRQRLSEAGMIVLLIPRKDKGEGYDVNDIFVVSRGFVFMKEADEVIDYIKTQTAKIISEMDDLPHEGKLRRLITNKLSKRLYGIIEREPMILPVFID